MNISSTMPSPIVRRAPKSAPTEDMVPKDTFGGKVLTKLADGPFPKDHKLSVILPAAGGLVLGAAVGLIGDGLGAGAALPGLAILGLAGAAIGTKIDGIGEGEGTRWAKILGGVGLGLGGAGVVAGALGGVPGAVVGAISLGGTGFALGHLYDHKTN